MAVVDINYKYVEENVPIYENVEVTYNNLKETKIFNSGNFVKDWFDANKFIIFEVEDPFNSHSSSINHFITDGAPYDSAYLKEVNKKEWELVYEYDFNDEGIEYFVHEGTKPTWKELKEMCK